jgi:prepilin-type N-terminal cleavage/methylation domain-containing protein
MTRTVRSFSLTSSRGDDSRSPRPKTSASLKICRSSRGFTLVELVFVAAIIVIILTIAIPSITAAQRGYDLSTAGYTISNKLDETRTNALKRNQQAWLLLDPAGPSLQVQFSTGGTTVNVGGPAFLSKSLTFVGLTTTQQVVFDPLGRPVSPPQTIQIQHIASGQGRTITVTSTGRITVQ